MLTRFIHLAFAIGLSSITVTAAASFGSAYLRAMRDCWNDPYQVGVGDDPNYENDSLFFRFRVSDIYPIAHKYNLPYHSQIVYNGALSVPIKSERPGIPHPCKVSNLTSRSLHP
jgi:hypothetical protein